MKIIHRFILLGTLFSGIVRMNAAVAQTVEVPLTHWSYDFLERLHTRGLIDSPLLSTRPLTRLDMAKMLVQVAKDPGLDKAEKEHVDFLLFEWREEVEALGGGTDLGMRAAAQAVFNRRRLQWLPDMLYRNARNLLSLRSGDIRAYLDPILYRDWTFNDPDTLARQDRVHQNTGGFTVWGTLGSRIGFFLDARDTRESGTRTYPRGARLAWERFGHAAGYGTHVYHDETIAYVLLNLPYVEVELGKNNNRWGPGRSGALALSDYATSYDQVKLSTRFWKARFTYIHGFLRQYPPLTEREYAVNGVTRKIFADKFLAAHRLEVRPWRWLQLGLYETVIYGERGIEMAYVNPINFYRSAEHYLGDRDNAMMGMDVELRPLRNLRLYAELMLDDFSVSRIGDNWYGNKSAWLAGAHLTNPFGLGRSDLRLEYVRVQPYVYSHTFPINAYQQYGSTLGHWAGPNADVLFGEWLYWLNRRWHLKLQGTLYRHGDNPADRNVGGDMNRAFVPGDSQTVEFLDGIKEQRTTIGVQASYEIVRNLTIRGGAQRERFLNAPASTGRVEVNTWSLFFAAGLNY